MEQDPREPVVARKKVLFVITKSNLGGAQRYVYDLAAALPQKQFEPVVLAGPSQGGLGAGKLFDMLARSNVRTIYRPELVRDMGFSDLKAFMSLFRSIKKERPAILHVNSSKAAVLGALAGRLCGVPHIVFTVHGWAFRESRNPISKALIYIASVITILASHTTICISEYDARAFPIFKKKIRVIRLGVALEERLITQAEARAKLFPSKHSDAFWVGSIAELNHNKDLETAISACAAAKAAGVNLLYTIIGDGDRKEQLAAFARRSGLGDSIRFTGYVPQAAQLLSAFDVFLLTSIKEGVPYVLLEAGHAQVPVIASEVGGIPELITNNENGILCPPKDIDAFAKAIIMLSSHEEVRKHIAAFLARRVQVDYSIQKMIDKTIDLYAA